MINNDQIDFSSYPQNETKLNLEFAHQLVIEVVQISPIKAAYKLTYFEKMLNFLRAVGLFVYKQNSRHISANQLHIKNTAFEKRVTNSLVEFLIQFDILSSSGRKVNNYYSILLENDQINKLIADDENLNTKNFNNKAKQICRDFRFVYDLIQKYNRPDYKFRHLSDKQSRVWNEMITKRELDYEIRLSETLLNLIEFRIPEKVKSPFNEDYYTESGQNAFKNFTRFRFSDFLKSIVYQNHKMHLFDLGCGYGNYIEVVNQNFPEAIITGIEKNETVVSATRNKFKESKTIQIIQNNFFDYEKDRKYDIILMNYVLFYFNHQEKKHVLEKAKSILADRGSIIICQYFSGIEWLKKDIAKKQNDYSLAKAIAMYYSNKVLYANTLWNDSVDTFSEAVKWNEFKQLVNDANFYIASMTNADPYYYSLFIELKQKN